MQRVTTVCAYSLALYYVSTVLCTIPQGSLQLQYSKYSIQLYLYNAKLQ